MSQSIKYFLFISSSINFSGIDCLFSCTDFCPLLLYGSLNSSSESNGIIMMIINYLQQLIFRRISDLQQFCNSMWSSCLIIPQKEKSDPDPSSSSTFYHPHQSIKVSIWACPWSSEAGKFLSSHTETNLQAPSHLEAIPRVTNLVFSLCDYNEQPEENYKHCRKGSTMLIQIDLSHGGFSKGILFSL